MKENATRLCKQFNGIDTADLELQKKNIEQFFDICSEQVYMQPPFHCNAGKNLRVGQNFLTNYNVKILDMAAVTIGDYCMRGPNTVIATVNHPMTAQGRKKSCLSPGAGCDRR